MNKTKYILNIAWDGKLGDAILSSHFIQHISQINGFSVITITTENLASLYKDYSCEYVFITASNSIQAKEEVIRQIKHKIDIIIYLKGRVTEDEVELFRKLGSNKVYSLDPRLNKESLELYNYHINKPFIKIFNYLFFSIMKKNYSFKNKLGSLSPIPIYSNGFVIFNPFGSRKDKSLSITKSVEILNLLSDSFPNINFKILYQISNINIAKKIVNYTKKHNVSLAEKCKNIQELFYLLSASDQIISVDTSIIHIAKVLNKPLLAVYPKFHQFNAWEPTIDNKTKIVYSIQKENYPGFGLKEMNNIDIQKLYAYFSENQKIKSIKLLGKIIHNLNIAHKNIAMQKPYFIKNTPEISHCHNGTINLIFEKKFQLYQPSFSIKDIYWTESKTKKESFDFFRISLHINGQIIPAWIYEPSNTPHKNDLYLKEILTEKLDLSKITEIMIEIPDKQNIIFIK